MDTQTKVAYACNILSMEGHTDTIYGHVSARVENAEQIWMKPATLGLEEVRPHDMLTLDLDGEKLAGVLPRHENFRSIPKSIASALRCNVSFTRTRHTPRPFRLWQNRYVR
jgi:ribulose-5-phosphate 4-epimerase/fuculose-1-phosphate aldolase